MSSISGSTKSRITSASSASGNISNVADSASKVQKSSLLSGIIQDVRPGGDVIIETDKGTFRAICNFSASEGDSAKVRIIITEDGSQKAEIFSVVNSKTPSAEDTTKPTFMNYIKGIFTGNRTGIFQNTLPASFSYIAPNLKVLDYGHLKPGDMFRVAILDPETAEGKTHIVNGSIISNENNSLMVNTEIGIMNIAAKSDIEAGQKILIQMLQMPGKQKVEEIRNLVVKLMSNIGQNIELLKKIIEARKSIASRTGYKKLLKLYLSPHDSAILAKIFHQSGEVPAGEVSRWIEKDIVEPFNDAAKNYRLGFLSGQMSEIRKKLEEAYIMPQNEWREVNIPIPDTPHYGLLKVKRSEKFVQFKLDVTHPQFGEINLQGMLELNLTNNSIAKFQMAVQHSKKLPEMLISNLKSIFNDHLATSNIKGSLQFSDIETEVTS